MAKQQQMGLEAKKVLESHSLPIENPRIEMWFQEAENRVPDSQPASPPVAYLLFLALLIASKKTQVALQIAKCQK